jgi:hypothetical protein
MRTVSTSTVALSVRVWCEGDGVALVEAEMEEEGMKG